MASHDEQRVRWHVYDDTPGVVDVQCQVHYLDVNVDIRSRTRESGPAPERGVRERPERGAPARPERRPGKGAGPVERSVRRGHRSDAETGPPGAPARQGGGRS